MSVEQDSSAQDSDKAQARITEVVENYIDFLTNGTAEQIADLYAPDATVEDPIGADVRNTREQLVEFYSIITNTRRGNGGAPPAAVTTSTTWCCGRGARRC